ELPYDFNARFREKTAIRSLRPRISDILPMPWNALRFQGLLPASLFVVFKLDSSGTIASATKPAFSTQLVILLFVNPHRCHGGLSNGNQSRPRRRRSAL